MVNCSVNSEAQKNMGKEEQTKIKAVEIDNKGLLDTYSEQDYLYRTYDPGNRSSGPNAMALYEDGSIFRYADQKVEFKDGKLTTVSVPLEWRFETKIKPSSVIKIKHLLDEFSNEKHSSIENTALTEISFYLNNELNVLLFEGEGSPKNYMIFNKINTEISLGRVSNEEE